MSGPRSIPIPPGTIFGQLTVISPAEPKGYNQCSNVLCACGNTKSIRNTQLRRGKAQSCGCMSKVTNRIRLDKHLGGSDREALLYRRAYASLLKRHKGRWDTCCITRSEHRRLIDAPCVYCGFEQSNTLKDRSSMSAGVLLTSAEIHVNGVDRQDSSLGYTTDNSFSCCSYCNKAKNDRKIEYFLHWVAEVYHKSVKNTHNDLQDII